MREEKLSIHGIKKLLEDVGKSFNEDLDACYVGYSGKNNNHPTERHLTFHIAKAFSEEFHIYPEVAQKARSAKISYDLVMLKKHHNRWKLDESRLTSDFIICESKRLYGTEQIGPSTKEMNNGILRDIQRIMNFKRPKIEDIWYKQHGKRFGLISILRWSEKSLKDDSVIKYWMTPGKYQFSKGKDTYRDRFFKEMKEHSANGLSLFLKIPLAAARDKKNIGAYEDLHGYLLFFVFEVPEPISK